LAEHFGWRAVFGLAALPILLTLSIFRLFARESPVRPVGRPLNNYLRVLKEADVQAGNFAALCVFAGSLLRPCGGFLADRFGGIRVLSILYALVALLLLELFMLPSLSIAVSMASLGTGNGAVFQLVPQRFGKEIGVATGIVEAAGGLGGFFLPAIIGAFQGS